MHTIMRYLEIDAGHRLLNHESKCKNVHGHRWRFEIHITADKLDKVGRVVDFGVVKERIGAWLDQTWDHGFLCNKEDKSMIDFLHQQGNKYFLFDGEPSSENIATYLFRVSNDLLENTGVKVVKIGCWETPNCVAFYELK